MRQERSVHVVRDPERLLDHRSAWNDNHGASIEQRIVERDEPVGIERYDLAEVALHEWRESLVADRVLQRKHQPARVAAYRVMRRAASRIDCRQVRKAAQTRPPPAFGALIGQGQPLERFERA